MPVFFCRWPNGDFSLVEAIGEEDAVEALDEFGNADGLQLIEVEDFRLALDFRLSDDGAFILDQIGDHTSTTFWRMYPKLEAAQEKGRRAVEKAVVQERIRIKEPGVPAADTELGKELQRGGDLPVSLANKIVNRQARKALQKFRQRGRPQ